MQNLYEKFYNKKKLIILYRIKPLISRLNNIRLDKILNILFLNDLNSFDV